MNLKQINEILENIENPTATPGVELVQDFSPNGVESLSQGDYNEKLKIYSTPIDGIFLSVITRTDSYGDNDYIHSVKFVTKAEKTIIEFEPLN
jgi:hypothetical protein